MEIFFFFGRNTLLKRQYILSKKKRFFVQKNLARKFYILKKQLKLFCTYSPFNLFFVIRSPKEYARMKTDLSFSQLGLLNFKFWHLKKEWILKIFKKQRENLKNLPLLNGAVLVIKLQSLSVLLETLLLFEHKNSVCVGFFFFGRMIWPSYFLYNILNLKQNWLLLQRRLENQKQAFISCFKTMFFFFAKFLEKKKCLLCRS